MWTYEISTGKLRDRTGAVEGSGYSGAPLGAGDPDLGAPGHINDPADESLKALGPIPEGMYTIGDPFDSDDHGPYCLRLTPDASNNEYGRGGFLMHGDSKKAPGTASKGCIVMPHAVRVAVHESGDNRLQVVAVYTEN